MLPFCIACSDVTHDVGNSYSLYCTYIGIKGRVKPCVLIRLGKNVCLPTKLRDIFHSAARLNTYIHVKK